MCTHSRTRARTHTHTSKKLPNKCHILQFQVGNWWRHTSIYHTEIKKEDTYSPSNYSVVFSQISGCWRQFKSFETLYRWIGTREWARRCTGFVTRSLKLKSWTEYFYFGKWISAKFVVLSVALSYVINLPLFFFFSFFSFFKYCFMWTQRQRYIQWIPQIVKWDIIYMIKHVVCCLRIKCACVDKLCGLLLIYKKCRCHFLLDSFTLRTNFQWMGW